MLSKIAKKFEKQRKAIIVRKGYVYETYNVEEYREFIKIANKLYPKNTVERKIDKEGRRIYIVFEDKLEGKYDIDAISRAIKNEEIYQISKALLWYLAHPMRTLIAVAIAGLFAGTYLYDLTQKFFAWLKSLPPDVAAKGFATISMITQLAVVIGLIAFVFYKRKKQE